MKTHIQKRPVLFSIVAAVIIMVLFLLAEVLIQSGLSSSSLMFVDSGLRIILAVLCLLFLGLIIQGNGFKFAFTTKGLGKGALASVVFILLALITVVPYITRAYIPQAPAVITQMLANGLFEESLSRGVLITAMLIKWGGTIKGRILIVAFSGVVFGAYHLVNFANYPDIGGILLFMSKAAVFGIGMAAIYAFSRNLLICMILHTLWDIAVKVKNHIALLLNPVLMIRLSNIKTVAFFIVIPLLAIVLCIIAKPFRVREAAVGPDDLEQSSPQPPEPTAP